jgi:hypothetical protein
VQCRFSELVLAFLFLVCVCTTCGVECESNAVFCLVQRDSLLLEDFASDGVF